MPTAAIIGRPGQGKSFVCASIARRALLRGRRVFANYDIHGAIRFGLADLPDLPPGIVIIDEAASWFHSRNWSQMSNQMMAKWNQTRKAGWDVFIATQHEDNLDAVIRRVIQYGWLLEARWSALTVYDPRVRALARIKTSEQRAVFHEMVDAGLMPKGARPPKVRAVEVARPLYVYGRCWDFSYFRSQKKEQKPLQTKRWWWDWDVAESYDTTEVLAAASSKELHKDREVGHADSPGLRGLPAAGA